MHCTFIVLEAGPELTKNERAETFEVTSETWYVDGDPEAMCSLALVAPGFVVLIAPFRLLDRVKVPGPKPKNPDPKPPSQDSEPQNRKPLGFLVEGEIELL